MTDRSEPRRLSADEQARLRDRLRSRKAAPLGIEPISGPVPLSLSQQPLWLLDQLARGGSYAVVMALTLDGDLEVDALKAALSLIIQRHAVLRTTIHLEEGEPVQRIADGHGFEFPVVDLTEAGPDGEPARVARASVAGRPFDLARGPLFRAQLLRFGPQAHELLLALHHIITDGWSLGLLVKELAVAYDAYAQGAVPALPELPIQYSQYAAWQRREVAGPAGAAHLDFWRDYLAGSVPTELPPDFPRETSAGHVGARAVATVPEDGAAGLRGLARGMGATSYMALLAGFAVLLHKLTGARDIVVGTPVANRPRPEFEPLIGCFVNSVMVRTAVAPGDTFRTLLSRVRDRALAAFDHQDMPFERLVQELAPTRDQSRNPLFQIGFNVLAAAGQPPRAGGVTFGPLRSVADTTRFDLEVHATDRGTIDLNVLYRGDLYAPATMQRLVDAYARVIAGAVSAPDSPIDTLRLMSEVDEVALIAGGTGVSTPYPRHDTLRTLLDRQFAARADAIAIEDGRRVWSYAQLARDAYLIAAALRACGVGPNTAVGLWLEREGRLTVAVVGVAVAGGFYVPVDVQQPAARAADMWSASGVVVVITSSALEAGVPSGPWRVLTLEQIAEQQAVDVPASGAPDDLAYVSYTSGSTGRPKGVAVSQRAVARLVCHTDYVELGTGTVMAQAASVAFDAATFEIWGALLNGGRLVVIPSRTVVDPSALGAFLASTHVNTIFLTTAIVHQIGQEAPDALSGVDTVLFGGEAVAPRWVAAIRAAGGPRRLLHVYGPTENTTFSTWFPVEAVDADAPTIPIGGPIACSTAYVLDRGGAVVPTGEPGELHVGGDGLAVGYIGAPRQTADRFVPDHISGVPGGRLYRTGDIVRWVRPGVIEFMGRRDSQVKIRGHRIELGEIETVLLAQAGVGTAAVMVAGEGADRRIVAFATPAEGATLDSQALRTALKQRLPAYMVPASLHVLDALPLNANGKVDRAALLRRDRVPAPVPTQVHAPTSRTRVEEQVMGVWRSVLGISAVGAEDNFFDLGGHSLLLVRVQTQLAAELGRTIPLVALFEHPTVAGLAAHLSGQPSAVQAPVVRDSAAGPVAIIGMAGRFPGAPDVETFWQRLRAGDEMIRRFSETELREAGVPEEVMHDPAFVPARGALEDIDQFDAALFGYSPREAALIDPQQRLLLETAWSALESAGYAPGAEHCGPVGVFVGCSANSYVGSLGRDALAGSAPLQVLLANDKDFASTRLAYKLRLTGPAVTVQTACSTSLVAVHEAFQAIRSGECVMALAGGASVTVPAVGGYRYHEEGIASPDGHCRPFDARAAGTVAGNGAGIVVLKSLARAIEDGDRIHAVIRGSAINNDGADKIGFTAPSVRGQAAVVRAALGSAGLPPASIQYIETHGTGTPLGDPIEMAALRSVFGNDLPAGHCSLGAVKANVGHLDAAAGVTGLIKTVLAIEHGEVPPLVHFESPSAEIDLGGFAVPTACRPWATPDGSPRRAGVSSFGMGGTNAHVVLEQAPLVAAPSADAERPDAWHVIPVSGQSAAALTAGCVRLADFLERELHVPAADVARTQQLGRAALPLRRAVVGRDREELVAALRAAAVAPAPSASRQAVVWVFPGQGTQVLEMGRALYDNQPAYRASIDACAEALTGVVDADLRTVLYPHPSEVESSEALLGTTLWTQVALVAVQISLAAQLRAWGLSPDAVVGHSVGEIAAACVAGVLTPEDAMRLAAARGRLMQAAPRGGMLAVSLPSAELLAELPEGSWLAASNAPRQSVIAGGLDALATAEQLFTDRGIPVHRLKAAGPFHSGLMEQVRAPLTAAAAALTRRAPHLPWISTVTASVVSEAEAVDPEYWGVQVVSPVRWDAATIAARTLLGRGVSWLEVGPGRTLTGLVSRSGTDDVAIPMLDGDDAEESALRALAALWCEGATPDWQALHHGTRRRVAEVPGYPFQRQRHWIERDPTRSSESVTPTPAGWCYVPAWVSDRRPTVAHGEHEHCLLVELEHSPIRTDLTAAIEQRGARVTGAACADVDLVLTRLDREGALPTRIVFVTGTGEPDHSDPLRLQHELHSSLRALATAADFASRAPEGARPLLTVLSTLAVRVQGADVLSPTRAALQGALRVVTQEQEGVRTRQIDIDGLFPSSSDAIVDDLLGRSDEPLVAWRAGRRWVQRYEPLRTDPSAPEAIRIVPGGTYLITGGLGRMGLAVAQHLATYAPVSLVLASRRSVPARDEWESRLESASEPEQSRQVLRALLALEMAGARVYTAAVDAADVQALADMVSSVEREAGPIRGVVHCAGATAAGDFEALGELTAAGSARQFRPKVQGALALAQVFSGRPLDFCVLASSLAGIAGGVGFGAYAMANAFMDAFAESATSAGQPWLSIAWDGWNFSEGAASRSGRQTPPALRPDEGIRAFAYVLRSCREGTVAVSLTNLEARRRGRVRVRRQEPAAVSATSRPESTIAFQPPAAGLEEAIAASWQQALGVSPIGRDDNFFELGGDSLVALHAMGAIQRAAGVKLALKTLWQHPTVARLAAHIVKLQAEVPTSNDSVARAMEVLDGLSDEDIDRMLSE